MMVFVVFRFNIKYYLDIRKIKIRKRKALIENEKLSKNN